MICSVCGLPFASRSFTSGVCPACDAGVDAVPPSAVGPDDFGGSDEESHYAAPALMREIRASRDSCQHRNLDGTVAVSAVTGDPARGRCSLCGDDTFPMLSELDPEDPRVVVHPHEQASLLRALEGQPRPEDAQTTADLIGRPRARVVVEHDLKTWPEYFRAILDGRKSFEIRRDDRGYSVGDVLVLREWDPERKEYTGGSVRRVVSYVTSASDLAGALGDGFVCMSIVREDGNR